MALKLIDVEIDLHRLLSYFRKFRHLSTVFGKYLGVEHQNNK